MRLVLHDNLGWSGWLSRFTALITPGLDEYSRLVLHDNLGWLRRFTALITPGLDEYSSLPCLGSVCHLSSTFKDSLPFFLHMYHVFLILSLNYFENLRHHAQEIL